MSKLVQTLKNLVQRDPGYSTKGPVLQGYEFVEQYGQSMYRLTFECAHGTRIPNEFGYFVQVQPLNTNKSRCTILVTGTEDGEGVPTFTERCSTVRDVNEYICEAKTCKQLVPKGTSPLEGPNIWESVVEYYDEVHDLLTTTTVLELNQISKTEFDNVLNVNNNVIYELTQTAPTPGLSGLVFTSYEEVRCGWYVVKKETISDSGYSYTTSESYHWPPVFDGDTGFDFGELIGIRDIEGVDTEYTAGVLMDYELKEGYHGPTKTEVTVAFVASTTYPVAPNAVKHMIPQGVNYQGIFISFQLPDCLHPTLTINEAVGSDHPVLKSGQTRSRTWLATNYTVWPDSIVGAYQARAHKGGFVTITKKYFKPDESGP